MATFYKFGKLWEIPPAAARLGKYLPANTQAFETFLTDLEPMLSNFITAHPRCPNGPQSAMPSRSSWRRRRRQTSSKNVGRRPTTQRGKSRMFHGSWAPLLISSTNWISRPWSRPPSKQSFQSSSPSRSARLLILLHLKSTRRPSLHCQAQHPGSPANPLLRPHPPPNRPASPGSGMRVPPPSPRSSSAKPRSAKHSLLRHAPREAAAKRSARAWANVIHLRLDD
jgi:hypothetical protein